MVALLCQEKEHMSNEETIKAWKDPESREKLTEAAKADLPANPAGPVDLSGDPNLEAVQGGFICPPVLPVHPVQPVHLSRPTKRCKSKPAKHAAGSLTSTCGSLCT